jgi:predicted ArsR family transcriptional regulator
MQTSTRTLYMGAVEALGTATVQEVADHVGVTKMAAHRALELLAAVGDLGRLPERTGRIGKPRHLYFPASSPPVTYPTRPSSDPAPIPSDN